MVARRNRGCSLARAALLAAGLALVGCGQTRQAEDGAKQDDGPTTPRLLPWQLQAAGTTPLALGVFDSLRGAHCRFLPDPQGELRCLPNPPSALELAGKFADAGCTERVFRALHLDNVAGVVERPLALPLPENDCEQRYVVGKLRELAVGEPRFAGVPGACRQVAPSEAEAGSHDFVVAEVTPPADWVSGREVDGPLVAERLRLRQFASEGQEAFAARLVDEQWNRSCSLRVVREQLVCVAPTISPAYSYFVDAECEADELWRADACSEAVYLGRADELYGMGPAWQGPIFSRGKVCEPLRDSEYATGASFFLRGEALGLEALPAAQWSTDGNQRLQLRGLRSGEGSFIALPDELFDSSSQRRYPFESHEPRFVDAEAGESCAPVWTRDAGVRCVPESTIVDPYTFLMYADEGCTEPAYFCADTGCPPALVLMAYDQNGEYRAVSRNRAVALTEVAYTRSGDVCTTFSAGGGPMFFKAGEALTWDDYPELEELNGRGSGEP